MLSLCKGADMLEGRKRGFPDVFADRFSGVCLRIWTRIADVEMDAES